MESKKPALTIITQSPELSRAIASYFRYKHRLNTQLAGRAVYASHYSSYSPGGNHGDDFDMLAVQNEVAIHGKILGIYPFWFRWGMHHNKRVYCITYKETDAANNIINWRDILAAPVGYPFSNSLDSDKVPHFNASRNILCRILKPHSGSSLFDLAAGLHTLFGNISIKLKNREITAQLLEKIKQRLLVPGFRVFTEFQKQETQYHSFISFLPGAMDFFATISRLKNVLSHLFHEKNGSGESSSPETGLYQKLEQTVADLYRFFQPLEAMIQGGTQ